MIQIDRDKCIGCGSCVFDCSKNNIKLVEEKAQIIATCFQCGHCVAICPQNAVSNPFYQEPTKDYDPQTFSLATQNVINAIQYRRSIRHFDSTPVGWDVLRSILIEGAGHAPTARNSQQNRYFVIQNDLIAFKEIIWKGVERLLETAVSAEAASAKAMADESLMSENGQLECAVSRGTLQNLCQLHTQDKPIDYLFKDAPCVIAIDSADPLDGGLAAAAIEAVALTYGLGVLYDGYLQRIIDAVPEAYEFLDRDTDKRLAACLLIGYPSVSYCRTAPRRRPSIILR